MRLAADTPFPEVYAAMTLRQKRAMDSVRGAQEELLRIEASLLRAQAVLHGRIYDAVEARIPVRALAEQLDLSVSRVYQIREEVGRHRT